MNYNVINNELFALSHSQNYSEKAVQAQETSVKEILLNKKTRRIGRHMPLKLRTQVRKAKADLVHTIKHLQSQHLLNQPASQKIIVAKAIGYNELTTGQHATTLLPIGLMALSRIRMLRHYGILTPILDRTIHASFSQLQTEYTKHKALHTTPSKPQQVPLPTKEIPVSKIETNIPLPQSFPSHNVTKNNEAIVEEVTSVVEEKDLDTPTLKLDLNNEGSHKFEESNEVPPSERLKVVEVKEELKEQSTQEPFQKNRSTSQDSDDVSIPEVTNNISDVIIEDVASDVDEIEMEIPTLKPELRNEDSHKIDQSNDVLPREPLKVAEVKEEQIDQVVRPEPPKKRRVQEKVEKPKQSFWSKVLDFFRKIFAAIGNFFSGKKKTDNKTNNH